MLETRRPTVVRFARHCDPKQRKAPVRKISIDAARFEAYQPIEVGGRRKSIKARALGPMGPSIVGISRREGQCDGLQERPHAVDLGRNKAATRYANAINWLVAIV